MSEKINRSDFLKAAALTAVAASAFTLTPLAAAHAQEDKDWEAILGKVKDLNEKEPVQVKAQFKDAEGNIVEEEKLFVRWEQVNRNAGRWIILSAFCTHLKCVVAYNSNSGKYECPCHGSEFDLEGQALKRPAKHPLPDYSGEAEERDGNLVLKRAAK